MTAAIPNQPRDLPLLATPDICSSKTYIVTGANSGLGLEAARHLVNAGAGKVILAVRNTGAGNKAVKDIELSTGRSGVAEVWSLDLSSFDSVNAFAHKATVELDRIHAVIQNAGVATSERVLAEGHNMAVTVNVLSTLLLGLLLLPKLKDVAQCYNFAPRLTFVSSIAGFDVQALWGTIRDSPLSKMDAEDMDQSAIYSLSKLTLTMAVRHLATLIPVNRTGVVVNLVCPGLCKTEITRNIPAEVQAGIASQLTQFGRTAEDGSRTLLHAALAGRETHGYFLQSCLNGEYVNHWDLPEWVINGEGKGWQRHTWDIISKELDSVKPGCV
ncbi:unnamed protein product [Penicillium egyptiacum]|uniref:Uncharacterized protein n=1 Tax=Penicillium egyptiacum TaxID=1303716 RepID=A0A9W4P0G2_9EURO|nr:unnamed protein product [Penicillium egyptiacum]